MTLGLLGLILLTGNALTILRHLYSPYAAFVAVVMLVEYVLLKGADRSALYRRELEAARQKRREDLLALREMETALVRLTDRLDRSPECASEEARRELIKVIERLRSRI